MDMQVDKRTVVKVDAFMIRMPTGNMYVLCLFGYTENKSFEIWTFFLPVCCNVKHMMHFCPIVLVT